MAASSRPKRPLQNALGQQARPTARSARTQAYALARELAVMPRLPYIATKLAMSN